MKLLKSSGKRKKPRVLIVRRIVGSSMEPILKTDQIVIASRLFKYCVGDMVVLAHEGLEKIKRIEKLEGGKIFVTGDNAPFSTDSRSFGWLPEESVIAKVIWPRR